MVIASCGVVARTRTTMWRQRRASVRAAVLQLGALLALAHGAAAQAAPVAPATPAAPATGTPPGSDRNYDKTIESALNEYRLGNWDEAAALFVKAHALRPSARTLRGMGLSEFENRKYVLALVHCSAALSDVRNPLNAEQRSELDSVIKRASEFVARVTLTVEPEFATVTVDGTTPYRDTADQILLDPGPHELVVSDTRGSERRRLEVTSGQRLALTVAVRPDPGTVPLAATTSTKEPDRVPVARILTYAGLGVLGVGLAVGTTAGVIVLGKAGDLEDACADDVCPPEQREELEQSEDLAVVANVAFIAAGVGAAAAAVGLVLLNSSGDDGESTEHVQVAVHPTGATLSGRF